MPLFLAVNLGKLTRIIPYNLCLFPAMLRAVKPDNISNTEGISEGKHIAHLFLVFSAMHLSGNILSNSATPFSIFPRGIEANARSVRVLVLHRCNERSEYKAAFVRFTKRASIT